MKKKAWKKPQLVALTRGRPEENTLTLCKVAFPYTSPGGAQNDFAICYVIGTTCQVACNAQSSS